MKVAREEALIPIITALSKEPEAQRVSQLASMLALIGLLNKASEHNMGRKKGKTRSLVELRKLNDHAIRVIDEIEGLGTEARQMLEKSLLGQGLSTWPVMKTLAALANAAAEAHAAIENGPPSPSPDTKPKKTASRAVARRGYAIFEELTGRIPTVPTKDGRAYGPFLDFLTEVFGALEIKASPEAAARAVIKEKRGATRQQTPLEPQ